MSANNFSLFALVCVSLAVCGCESERYKPADWNSAQNSTMSARSEDSAAGKQAGKNLERPDTPTNWMELSGTGGEAVTARGTMPARFGSTLPNRGSTLPLRAGSGGTSMPWRTQGTTLSVRNGQSSNTSLPARNNNSTNSNQTTRPRR